MQALSQAIWMLTPDDSVVLWSNVLQYVADDGAPVRDMPRRSCLSKRALQTAYTRLDRRGLAVIEAGAARGDKTLQLTNAGRAARDSWAPVDPPGDAASSLRSALVPIVEALECEQAHFPTQYGTADCSIRGGPGQDWKPVPRGDAAEHRTPVPSLPLLALLSQCFLAMAIEYETLNGALAQVANVLSMVPDEGLDVAELPADGVRLLVGMERHRQVTMSEKGRRVHLTPVGRSRRDRHEATSAEVDRRFRERHGDAVVDALVLSLRTFVGRTPDTTARGSMAHPPTAALFGSHPLR